MQKAMQIVAAASEVHGKERYDLLVEAAKILVAVRKLRIKHLPLEGLTFQRSAHLVAITISKLGGWVGSMAAGVPLADKRLYARVKRIVNAADPIGLLRQGAPDDEYHPEIDEIAFWLPKWKCRTVTQTHAVVYGVFVTWFGARVAGPRGAYRRIATEIHELRRQRSGRKKEA